MTPEEFRKIGHQLINWIADYRTGMERLPVGCRVQPGSVMQQLPSQAPADPQPFSQILGDLESIVMPALCHWQHPCFFGYFPSNGSLASVLGDYLSTGLGVLGLSWQSSPALTELETRVVDWMRELFGLSSTWQGVIQDTASTSTLVALICARERASNFSAERGGLQSETAPLVVYVSEQSHSSVDKAAWLAGLGRDNVRHVACDARYAMDPADLERQIDLDLESGKKPCAVVVTIGTTATTAIDPLEAIADIAHRRGLWIHVDTAMAGSAMILPECRWMWQGIERADSLVINAHKWLGVAFDCSLYYVRDPQHLVRVMSTNPSYLQSAADQEVNNYRDWGIPLGRRFRALKLWCLLRAEGVAQLQSRLRRDMENAAWLAEQIQKAPDWRIVAPVVLQTVCVRHEPAGWSDEEIDAHTRRWVDEINFRGEAYLTPALVNRRWMCRISIGAESTQRPHIARLWTLLQSTAQKGQALL